MRAGIQENVDHSKEIKYYYKSNKKLTNKGSTNRYFIEISDIVNNVGIFKFVMKLNDAKSYRKVGNSFAFCLSLQIVAYRLVNCWLGLTPLNVLFEMGS